MKFDIHKHAESDKNGFFFFVFNKQIYFLSDPEWLVEIEQRYNNTFR